MATARDRLIEAAFALFDERGYDATTVDEIAEWAGTGRTTFFRHFGSKEAVIFPDHDELLDQIRGRLTAAGRDARPVAVTEAARLVLLHYLEEGDLAKARYRLTTTVPALRDRELAGMVQYQRVFRTFIHEWLGGGPETSLRAELMAAAVVTAHNHVLRAWLRGQTEHPLEDFDTAMAEVVALFDQPANAQPGSTVVVLRSCLNLEVVVPQLRRALREADLGKPISD